ncbi:hypothetical protein [Spiroplasma monobiae]|uniref:Glycosyl hydrolase family 32 N-terminal domain-containing protein n=1 Tax=Spiroplasma monobiae MQ-1 TaxID=1336748 RepID=A0A2K9LTK0_SPISQ|nr:hypothetical protein [Spiroplasma monobiae]AUM62402.1 hypothetical protein SMONO_v1c01510 [Spiroplasma monobiae MQ-1]
MKKWYSRKIMFKLAFFVPVISVAILAPLNVVSCGNQVTISKNDRYDRPINWYSPYNTVNGSSNAFANDNCSILWDEEQQLFYSWMLFRDNKGFPSGWVEMTSPDLNNWTQGKYRIKQGREFDTLNGKGKTSALGGSVWVDTKGDFFEKGDVVFVLSMQPSKILIKNDSDYIGSKATLSSNYTTSESGIAYFVSHGLGQEFYTSGVLSKDCLNNDGSMNWRDTALFETDDGLYFAISANNRLEFWKINHFDNKKAKNEPKITKVSEMFVRNIGVEVPNVVRMGENLWYISASVQDNPFGGPFQSGWWSLCEWDKEKGFVHVKKSENGDYVRIPEEDLQSVAAAKEVQKEQPNNKVIEWSKSSKYSHLINPWTANEYGTEGYAQRVVNPYQTQETIQNAKNPNKKSYAKFAIARSMTSNWAYDTDIWSWKGGSYGSEKIEFNEKGELEFSPYDKIAGFSDNGTAVYHLKGSDLNDGYNLKFNGQNFTFKLSDNVISWKNEIKTGLKKWTEKGGPANEDDEIIIVWNKCTLTFYNKTKNWNAHFMLPQGTTHEAKEGAKSIV